MVCIEHIDYYCGMGDNSVKYNDHNSFPQILIAQLGERYQVTHLVPYK